MVRCGGEIIRLHRREVSLPLSVGTGPHKVRRTIGILGVYLCVTSFGGLGIDVSGRDNPKVPSRRTTQGGIIIELVTDVITDLTGGP